jgi:hypothetical protein
MSPSRHASLEQNANSIDQIMGLSSPNAISAGRCINQALVTT